MVYNIFNGGKIGPAPWHTQIYRTLFLSLCGFVKRLLREISRSVLLQGFLVMWSLLNVRLAYKGIQIKAFSLGARNAINVLLWSVKG
jgi:hypothetical protein